MVINMRFSILLIIASYAVIMMLFNVIDFIIETPYDSTWWKLTLYVGMTYGALNELIYVIKAIINKDTNLE